MTMTKTLKCAIYTRKSTDEGLEQDYNSLDAQRDAGEAYVKSQQHEGWRLNAARYDDGGYSGGNMERPGLKTLLTDIKAGKINVVVVYKIDRLTRSLTDFSRLVEVFDEHNVTFVSVTQSFNTTSSMGRLTLNVLLSFAQFEREVTGERIRDKFAASKKKGMWMGGRLILGYDLGVRKLIINEAEAEQVRFVFHEYLKLDSTLELLAIMRQRGIKTKSWVTQKGIEKKGQFYSSGTLYGLLKNPIYCGKMHLKGQLYDAEHEAIIDEGIWQQVQEKLESRRPVKCRSKHPIKPYILLKKLYNDAGHRYTMSYSTKKKPDGERHIIRYYIHDKRADYGYIEAPKRLNADEVERLADILLQQLFKDHQPLYEGWHDIIPSQKEDIIIACLHHFEISSQQIKLSFKNSELNKVREQYVAHTLMFSRSTAKPSTHHINGVEIENNADMTICTMGYVYRNHGGKKIITSSGGHDPAIIFSSKNSNLINALVTASQCHDLLEKGECRSVVELAAKFKRDRSYISKILKLQYLSPKIKSTILDGRQPRTMTVQSLLKAADEVLWEKQEKLVGVVS